MTIDEQIPGLYINAKQIIGILADPLFKMTLLLTADGRNPARVDT